MTFKGMTEDHLKVEVPAWRCFRTGDEEPAGHKRKKGKYVNFPHLRKGKGRRARK